MKRSKRKKQVIGRVEEVEFPEWGLTRLDAKVDSGAFTSSLHCHDVEVSPDRKTVRFFILDPAHPEYENRRFTSSVTDIRSIRSSNGLKQERIVIRTTMILGGTCYPVELSLADRSEMKYPVLLGRKFLRKQKFVIDVSKTYLGRENR